MDGTILRLHSLVAKANAITVNRTVPSYHFHLLRINNTNLLIRFVQQHLLLFLNLFLYNDKWCRIPQRDQI